jgi:DNA-binding transcriptional regulator YdaS (Cro superfamily)
MTLKQYFKTQPIGRKMEVAKQLGITPTWLGLLISKKKLPSAVLCVAIEKLIGVKRETLRPDLFK